MMATVGPITKTAKARAAANSKLMVDSHLMPRVTPVTAEVMNSAVVTAMMATCDVSLTGRPNKTLRPLLICKAPMPSDAATPKAVAMTANTLTSKADFLAKRQGSASIEVLTKAAPPRRNWKNAIAKATML